MTHIIDIKGALFTFKKNIQKERTNKNEFISFNMHIFNEEPLCSFIVHFVQHIYTHKFFSIIKVVSIFIILFYSLNYKVYAFYYTSVV